MERFLESLYKKRGGIKLGIGRTEEAFSLIKSKDIPVYHVAGTNGKGTTVYAISHLLKNLGHTVGTFISPHIVDFNERIAVNGENISDAEITEIFQELEHKIPDFDELSFFEITFLLAWRYFETKGVTRAVIEVGLGGRLDATNVIKGPKTDIIASIGLDHTKILGETVSEIALEKLGIVKKGDILLTGVEEIELLELIKENGITSGASRIFSLSDIPDFKINYPATELSPHQKHNLKIAAYSVMITEHIDFIPDFRDLSLPGRYQKFGKNIILDIAHNPPAISSLIKHVIEKEGRVNILYGAMKDKDIAGVMEELAKAADKIFILTLDNNGERGASAKEILERVPNHLKNIVLAGKTNEETLLNAYNEVLEGKKLLITGSFFTVEMFLNWHNKMADK